MKKEYNHEDLIIPMINFTRPTVVRVTITDKHLNVFIGPRDIQFDLETGRLTASGTMLCNGASLKKLDENDGNTASESGTCPVIEQQQ